MGKVDRSIPKPTLKEAKLREDDLLEKEKSSFDLDQINELWAKEEEILAEADDYDYKSEEYCYFNYDNFLNGLHVDERTIKDAQEFIKSDRVKVEHLQYGYINFQGRQELVGDAECSVFVEDKYDKKFLTKYRVTLRFISDRVISTNCGNYTCFKYRDNKSILGVTICSHIVASIMKIQEVLKKGSNVDATNMEGYSMLSALFSEDMEKKSIEKNFKIVPSLTIKGDSMVVTFKAGDKKLYKIKDLNEFLDTLLSHEDMQFGTKAVINIGYDILDDKSRMWADYIRDIIMADTRQMDYMSSRTSIKKSSWYYTENEIKEIKDKILLFGSYLDDFFECASQDDSVEYEWLGEDKEKIGKGILKCVEGNLDLKLEVKKMVEKTRGIVQGVSLSGDVPELIKGHNNYYYFDSGILYRVDSVKAEQLMPLWTAASAGKIDVRIGRNHLAKFYRETLPKLKKIVDITEYDHDEMLRYIPPAPEFMCFLDLVDGKVLCKPTVNYGIQRFNVTDWFEASTAFKSILPFRSRIDETNLLSRIVKYIPDYYADQDILVGEKDDEGIYELLDHGLQELMEISEVRVTDRFKRINVINRAQFSMGISVDSGIMDLEITSDDISREELLDILFHYNLKRRFIRLKNGDFFKLDGNEAVERLAQMMETLHIKPADFVKGKMHIPAYRALYLDKMMEKSQDIYTERDSHFKSLIKEFKTIDDADFELPDNLKHVLRKYQKNGYRWLRTLDKYGFGGILADEMGLGKTLQTIAVLLAVKLETGHTTALEEKASKKSTKKEIKVVDNVSSEPMTSLIVCPASLVYNWGEELTKFAPELNVGIIAGTAAARKKAITTCDKKDVIVTSYDLLKRDINLYEDKSFRFQIIDEAQYIKNHNTAAAKAVKVINAKTKFALTGTPIENRLSELWSIFDYLMPGFLYSYEDFRESYEIRIVRQSDAETVEMLRKMVAPFILRRLKGDVLTDLPDKLEETRVAVMEDKQRKLYDGQVVKMKKLLESQSDSDFSKNKLQVLSELTRIRQICCDPSLCFEDYDGESAKRQSCMELIESLIDGGHKALIFSQFTSMLELLEEDLKKMEIPYYKITGATPKEKRLELVSEFNQNDIPIFLISLKAGGTGLNLTGADVVIHYDPWWNVAAQNQATDRAHRIGQKSVVTVYRIIVKDTIEEKIIEMQEAKKKLADDILSADGISSTAINRDELLQLLV